MQKSTRRGFLLHPCVALLAAALLVVIVGCTGQAAVLREDAGTTAELATAAVTQARTFYKEEADRQLNYYLDILSQDPSCPADSWVLVYRQTAPSVVPFRCLTQDEIRLQRDCPENGLELCSKVDVLYLTSAGASFQTVLTLIEVVAEYQSRLAEVARSSQYDTAKDLADLRTRVEDLKGKIDILLGSGAAEARPEDDPIAAQIAAVGPLLDILRSSADDAHALDTLRTALTREGAVFEAALAQLASRYANVDLKAARLSDLQQFEGTRKTYNQRVAQGLTAQDPPATRRAALAEVLKAESELRERLSRPDALSLALSQLAVSHRSLREAVTDGTLSDEQRRRIAEKNLAALKAVFGAVVGIVRVFS